MKKAQIKCWWNCQQGVNFTNILRAAFALEDPKSTKTPMTWLSFFCFRDLESISSRFYVQIFCLKVLLDAFLLVTVWLSNFFLFPCHLSCFLEEPSFDPCYPIRAVRGQQAARLQSSRPGMSNSNHCTGRTLSFKARKAYSGPHFRKTWHFLSILDIF
jgi:hypothetical protein